MKSTMLGEGRQEDSRTRIRITTVDSVRNDGSWDRSDGGRDGKETTNLGSTLIRRKINQTL